MMLNQTVQITTRSVRAARHGLTLIEVMISLGIIGILASILVPAVQQSRAAAQRTSCKSNLRQLLLAHHQHAESHGVFPSIVPIEGKPWANQIAPYLELQPKVPDIPGGAQIGVKGVIFNCPTDPHSSHGGETSYRMNNGYGNHRADGFARTLHNNPVRPRDVTDGLSNTAALAEKLVLPSPQALATMEYSDPALELLILRKTDPFIADYDLFSEECEHRSYPPIAMLLVTWEYNHIQPPNRKSCTNGNRNRRESVDYLAHTTTSLHVGGVHVGFGDGAVRFLADSIDRHVWRSLGTRNGNEPISGFGF